MKEYTITWSGQHISLNQWYSSKHWTYRDKQKKKWSTFFTSIASDAPVFKKYEIILKYNSRLDPSNTITMIKLYEDFLVKNGKLVDDSKKYCKGVHIFPDEEMGKKEYTITIKEVK